MLSYQPRLGAWRPDNTQPDVDPNEDYSFDDDLSPRLLLVESLGSSGVIDLRRFCSPVEDQGLIGSCVGNAVVGGLEFEQVKAGLPLKDLSRMFVYYNSRLMHRDHDKDKGTFIRLGMGTLSSIGTCSEAKWPYDTSKVFVRPTWGSYREAYANKIGSYYRITATGNTRNQLICRALESQHTVVFGMKVDEDYINTGPDGLVKMPKAQRVNPGGHAQLIVGVDYGRKLWLVRNSWGTGWAMGGYAWVPWDYLDVSDANDFWVPTGLR